MKQLALCRVYELRIVRLSESHAMQFAENGKPHLQIFTDILALSKLSMPSLLNVTDQSK